MTASHPPMVHRLSAHSEQCRTASRVAQRSQGMGNEAPSLDVAAHMDMDMPSALDEAVARREA